MAIIVGSGEHRYEVIENWGKLPDGWHYGEVAAVGVDSKDNVYVFTRGEHPMIVFDRDGNFLRSWGEGLFKRPHGVHLGAGRHDLLHRRRRPHGAAADARREAAAGDRRAGRTGAAVRAAIRSIAARTPRCRPKATSTSPTATATRGCTSTRRTASCCSPGASRAPTRARSTSCTTSAATRTAGSTSPTARTTACRCSTARASTTPVEQPASAVRAVHDARQESGRLYRRERPGHGGECEVARHRSARHRS